MKTDLMIDAKGLACPMPIVRAKKGMDTLTSGQILQLEATDKGSVSDFQAWASRSGHEMLKMEEDNGVYRFFVKKA